MLVKQHQTMATPETSLEIALHLMVLCRSICTNFLELVKFSSGIFPLRPMQLVLKAWCSQAYNKECTCVIFLFCISSATNSLFCLKWSVHSPPESPMTLWQSDWPHFDKNGRTAACKVYMQFSASIWIKDLVSKALCNVSVFRFLHFVTVRFASIHDTRDVNLQYIRFLWSSAMSSALLCLLFPHFPTQCL